MKTTQLILAAAAFAALADLSHAQVQGLGGATLPECTLQCRPMLAEENIFVCVETCLIDEGTEDFIDGLTAGDPHMPLFELQGCDLDCAFGDEIITYSNGDLVDLNVGLWKIPSGGFVPQPSTLVSVQYFVTPLVSTLVQSNPLKLPYTNLGFGQPPSGLGPFATLQWDTTLYDDPAGYLIRAEMFDTVIGFVDAYTVAYDPKACGHFSYGAVTSGAPESITNKLDLQGLQSTCLGQTATYRSQFASSSTTFFLLSMNGTQLPLFGGWVWIDPTQVVQVAAEPTTFGGASYTIQIPTGPSLDGEHVFVQSASFEAATPFGLALSNGVRTELCACP